MVRHILTVAVISLVLVTGLMAEEKVSDTADSKSNLSGFSLYTQIGQYIDSSVNIAKSYRDSGFTCEKLPYNLGLKVFYKVYDGTGFSGFNGNFRIGVQLYCKEMQLSDKLFISPYAGGSYNNSSTIPNSTSIDAGACLNYKGALFNMADLVAGEDTLFFADSPQLEYYAGFKITVCSGVDLSLLYSAIWVNSQHMIGYGGKLSFGL